MALELNTHFVYALDFVGELFQHPWRGYVIENLNQLKNSSSKPLAGKLFSVRLGILLREGCRHRTDLAGSFNVTEDKLTYRGVEGNFEASIEANTGKDQGVTLTWTVGKNGTAQSALSYRFDGDGVKLVSEKVAPHHLKDVKALWSDAALLIGELGLRKMLNEQSPFYRATVEHAQRAEELRAQFKKAS